MDDMVVIAEDSPETMQLAELSLKTLKHVLIARPDRLNIEQINYLKRLAEESGVILHPGTGYKFCPVYEMLTQKTVSAKVIEIKHQLTNSGNLYSQFRMELFYDLDFVTDIMNTEIRKFSVKSWKSPENLPDIINCRLECDNGCIINIMAYTVTTGKPKLDITFFSSEAIIFADIFGSIIKKLYRTNNLEENIILDAYCEETVYNRYLACFNNAIGNNPVAIRDNERLFQNMAVVHSVMEKTKPVSDSNTFRDLVV
jgi:hypothetical protein